MLALKIIKHKNLIRRCSIKSNLDIKLDKLIELNEKLVKIAEENEKRILIEKCQLTIQKNVEHTNKIKDEQADIICSMIVGTFFLILTFWIYFHIIRG